MIPDQLRMSSRNLYEIIHSPSSSASSSHQPPSTINPFPHSNWGIEMLVLAISPFSLFRSIGQRSLTCNICRVSTGRLRTSGCRVECQRSPCATARYWSWSPPEIEPVQVIQVNIK